jgi:hypothetical protein
MISVSRLSRQDMKEVLMKGVKTVLNGLYIAANIFYKRDYHNSEISHQQGSDSLLTAIDDFAAKKNVIWINILAGLQKKLINHFCYDIYIGVGYRIRFTHDSFLNYDPATDKLIKPDGFDIRTMRNETDLKSWTSYSPSFTMGLRLGYRF